MVAGLAAPPVVRGAFGVGSQGARQLGCVELEAVADDRIPIHTFYDAEHNTLVATRESQDFWIDPSDARCRALPRVGALIKDAMSAHAEALAQTCAEVRASVEAGLTEVRGHPVDLSAGKQFLARWCRQR